MTTDPPELKSHVSELERAAARLRSGEAGQEEAAALAERCAELASLIVASLEDEVQAGTELPLDEPTEQERLL